MIDNIDFENLRAIGLTQGVINRISQLPEAPDLPANARLARVIETQRDSYALHDGLRELQARTLRHTTQVTVGDWAVCYEDEHGDRDVVVNAYGISGVGRLETSTITASSAEKSTSDTTSTCW